MVSCRAFGVVYKCGGLKLIMSPKKIPVRIGLTKKPANADNSDMSASTMEALEDIGVLDVEQVHVEDSASVSDPDDDLQELPEIEDEIEQDADPDYVPEPSTSTKDKQLINRPHVQPKRSLKLLNKDKDVQILRENM